MSTTTVTKRFNITAVVMRWCRFYTRDMPLGVATERQDELASDLYEHNAWAESAGIATSELRRSILARAVRGVPADLSWRYAQRRGTPIAGRGEVRVRRADSAVVFASVSAGLLVVLWGLYVLARVVASAARGDIRPWSETAVILTVATALAVLGLVLLVRKKTRTLGTVWLILPTVIVIPTGLYQLFSISATVGALFNQPQWAHATNLLTLGLALFFIAASLWLWPSRAATGSNPHETKKDSQ